MIARNSNSLIINLKIPVGQAMVDDFAVGSHRSVQGGTQVESAGDVHLGAFHRAGDSDGGIRRGLHGDAIADGGSDGLGMAPGEVHFGSEFGLDLPIDDQRNACADGGAHLDGEARREAERMGLGDTLRQVDIRSLRRVGVVAHRLRRHDHRRRVAEPAGPRVVLGAFDLPASHQHHVSVQLDQGIAPRIFEGIARL